MPHKQARQHCGTPCVQHRVRRCFKVKHMRSIQATGKSVDAAIFSGLQQLGLSIDEVTINVIQHGTKGLLGIGAKPAIVELTEKPAEEVVVPDFTAELARERRERTERRGNRDNRSRPQRQNREEEPAPEAVKEPPVNYTEEAAEGEPAAQFVTELIEKMGISGKVLAAREEDAIRLRIDSDTMGVLIGHRGETLDAIQYLTGLVINRNRKVDGYTRVTINTEDYREKREETLIRLARRVAAQVKSTGRPRTLEAMNPYERRILHSALQNNPYVTTHSEGEEPNRRVVVAPKRGRRPQRPRDKA